MRAKPGIHGMACSVSRSPHRHVVRTVRPHAEAQSAKPRNGAVGQHHLEMLDGDCLRLRGTVDVHELREDVR